MTGPPDRAAEADPSPTEAAGAARRARASNLVAAGIFVSRISGLIRERALAHFFGASPLADVWRAGFRLPNVLQILLGEGTLSASFIPIYSELLEDGRDREAARFAGAALGLLTVAAGVLGFAGILLAPVLVPVVFGGFDPARQALTIDLVRILFPMTALLVLSAWALGILNSHRRFFLSYIAPVAWNAAIITVMLVGGLGFDLSGEALVLWTGWGALVGGGLQFGVQLPLVARLIGEFRPSVSLAVVGVREAIQNFIPVVAARGAQNIGGLLDVALASYLAAGAVATLGYAQILYLLPISLFGLSVAASELPELSRDRQRDNSKMGAHVGRAMERVAYFLIPATLAYLALGDVIAGALFQTGAFGRQEVLVTWAVLAAYALGMSASAVSRLLSSAFYALRDTRTPARIAYLRVGLALVIGASLMFPFDRVGVGSLRLGAVGLALGASVAAWVEWALLRRSLRKAIGKHASDRGRLLRITGAAFAGVAVGYGAHLLLPEMHPVLRAMGTLVPFGGVYLAATLALGVAGPIRSLISR